MRRRKNRPRFILVHINEGRMSQFETPVDICSLDTCTQGEVGI